MQEYGEFEKSKKSQKQANSGMCVSVCLNFHENTQIDCLGYTVVPWKLESIYPWIDHIFERFRFLKELQKCKK